MPKSGPVAVADRDIISTMMSAGIEIRDAVTEDLAAILSIYNDVIRTSDAVFTEQERTPGEQEAWWHDRVRAGLPVLVSVCDGQVAGFASYGPFRPWPGYRQTVEHSVYVRAGLRGGGHGKALLGELLSRAGAAGMHVMIAGVDAGNAASLGLHEAFGFQRVGRLGEVAIKHGRRLDLVLLQRRLENP